MKKLFTILLLSIMIYSPAFGQAKRNYFPIGIFNQENTNIYGVSIGLNFLFHPSKNTKTNGIKLDVSPTGIVMLIPGIPIAEDKGAFDILKIDTLSERVNGIAISATAAICDCKINGFTIGSIGGMNRQVNGITMAGLINFTQQLNGFQFGLLVNATYILNGIQVGGNNSSTEARGI
jgi:hypothetical protein